MTVFRSDSMSVNKTSGMEYALPYPPPSYKCRHELESCDECVWVEISTSDGLKFLIGNHCFSPDAKARNIDNYLLFF
jgi:hypothetical protein